MTIETFNSDQSVKSVVFIDGTLQDIESLLSGLVPSTLVVVLDPSQDGIQQISDVLSSMTDLNAIHVISHGASGMIQLGNTQLTQDNLGYYQNQLTSIGHALSDNGDLLLYGCEVAQGSTGQSFIADLARATGADVAASTDLTGPAVMGGNWQLEATSGSIETEFDAQALMDYPNVLSAANTAPRFSVGDGKLTTDLGQSREYVTSSALQADGKILVAGYSVSNYGYLDFTLVRYNNDGSLDSSLDGDGMLITDFGGASDYANSVTVQPDGQILLAGVSNGDFALARYNVDGSLDTSFGSDGKLVTNFSSSDYSGPSYDVAYSVVLQEDGKILLVGDTSIGKNDFALLRYNSDGSLDTGFDEDGKLVTSLGIGSYATGYAALVQPDGKILVAGTSGNGYSISSLALVRYNADGSLDTSFNGEGKVTTAIDGYAQGFSVALQADGKILVAGNNRVGNYDGYDFALVRYNSDGTLDTGFGAEGIVTTGIGTSADYGRSVTLQADGKILVAGHAYINGAYDFALVRYNSDGSLDASFDGDGRVTTGIGLANDSAYNVLVQSDGKILVTGTSTDAYSNDSDFAVARYNADGSLDTSFDLRNTLNGIARYTENGPAVILDNSVSIFDAELARLNDGTGNYSGATITLTRHGGANSEDAFSGANQLSFSNGSVVLAGISIGSVSNGNGILSITFNGNATQAVVNEILSSIAYSNRSDSPPNSVQIDWTFDDGNSGNQGVGGALQANGSTIVDITPTNDNPVITGTLAALPAGTEDVAYTVFEADLLAGISDPEGDPVALYALSADQGVEISNGNGSWTITPTRNYSGVVRLDYTVTDGKGGYAAVQQEFVLDAVNDAPVVNGYQIDYGYVNQLYTVTKAQLLAFCSDADGDALNITGLTVDHGTVVDNGNSSWTITPTTNYSGTVTYNYSVSDGHGGNASGMQQIILNPAPPPEPEVNSAPTLTGTSVTFAAGLEGIPYTFNIADLLVGYTDPEGDRMWVYRISSDQGQVEMNEDGTATFTPYADFAGTATISYSIETSPYGFGSGLQTITIAPINDTPSLNLALGDGKVITSLGRWDDSINSLLLQPDGKILALGSSVVNLSQNREMALTRYNADGTLDSSFDADGKLIISLGDWPSNGVDLLLQADGKILTAGQILGGINSGFALARFNDDGSLDTSFSGDGILNTSGLELNMSGVIDGYKSVIMQSDGKMVLVGSSGLLRINTDGTLDTSFSDDGKISANFGLAYAENQEIILQSDGKILVAGDASTSRYDYPYIGLARYNSDGSPDTSFSADGKLITNSFYGIGWSATLQADGKILVAGEVFDGNELDFVLVRYNSDGSLDGSFSNDGMLITDLGSEEAGYAVTVQPDGKILIAGARYQNNDTDFALVRYNADGSLDTSFSGDGKLTTSFGAGYAFGYHIAVQSDGKILVAGENSNGTDYDLAFSDFALARYNADGSLDTTFGRPTYTVKGAPVILDANAAVNDIELSKNDNYKGASLTLVRSSGSKVEDVFAASGNLSFSNDNAFLSGVVIGTVSNSNGTLIITFNDNATQTRVNETLSSITYANTSSSPLSSVQISWKFYDGNSGSQGEGGNLYASGSTSVTIVKGSASDPTTPPPIDTSTDPQTIAGTNGNDTLTSTAEHDMIFVGGKGNDTYLIHKAGDTVIESTGGGTDTVRSTFSWTLGDNIENLTLTGSDSINGIGNSLANVIAGNSGNNRLDGGVGRDTLTGGSGDDIYVVDYTKDKTTENVDAGHDTVLSSVSWKLGANFENLTLTGSGNINGTGNTQTNTVIGNSGNNVLDGGGLADTLAGAAGDDTYLVDNVADLIMEEMGEGTDLVKVALGTAGLTYLLGDNIEQGMLSNKVAINLSGNSLANTLTGNTAANVLDGGSGADTLIGGKGNDTYLVDNALDTISESKKAGTDTVSSNISWALGPNLENLTLTGDGHIEALGNELANILLGNAGGNLLNGRAGNDILSGGSGADGFVFSYALNSKNNLDMVTDFSHGEGDRIELAASIFTVLTPGELSEANLLSGAGVTAAATPDQHLIYNSTTGGLYYDADGSGGKAAIQFATIGLLGISISHPEAMTASDFWIA